MTSIQSLHTAMSGLVAARRRIETHGHNIANASTEGYTAQREVQQAAGAGFVPRMFAQAPVEPGGVISLGVERQTDALLRNRLNVSAELAGGTKADARYLSRVENAFAEPSASSLSSQLNQYWAAWGALSVSPDSQATRQQVLSQGDQVAYTFRRIDTELAATLDFAGQELAAAASEINDLATQVADLNQSIVASGTYTNVQADLLDQRDRILERLASLAGAQSVTRSDGQAAVYLGGRLLVDNANTMQVKATSTSLQWSSDSQTVAAGGYVGSVHTLISTTIPQFRTKLDAIANKLINDVNTLHAAGEGQDGVSGRNFFSGSSAATISVSADVAGDTSKLAARSAGGGPLDGTNAHALGDLADAAGGADDAYMSYLSDLGVTVRTATSRNDAQELVLDSARRDLNSVGQVNLDDELAELTAAQRAYQAAARVVTTVDEMLETLISRFGRVGA